MLAPNSEYFDRTQAEHAFRSLTESNKPGTAHRTGIYLTRVTLTYTISESDLMEPV